MNPPEKPGRTHGAEKNSSDPKQKAWATVVAKAKHSSRILFGYIAGISSKLVNEAYMASIGVKWYVLFFYVLNFLMVSLDLCLYVRNYRLDKANGEK